jgi:hypothetical protein
VKIRNDVGQTHTATAFRWGPRVNDVRPFIPRNHFVRRRAG